VARVLWNLRRWAAAPRRRVTISRSKKYWDFWSVFTCPRVGTRLGRWGSWVVSVRGFPWSVFIYRLIPTITYIGIYASAILEFMVRWFKFSRTMPARFWIGIISRGLRRRLITDRPKIYSRRTTTTSRVIVLTTRVVPVRRQASV
jgi:hypothetical protein